MFKRTLNTPLLSTKTFVCGTVYVKNVISGGHVHAWKIQDIKLKLTRFSTPSLHPLKSTENQRLKGVFSGL